MQLISVRIIANDIKKMVHFYEQVTGISPIWYTEDFAELKTNTATLAIGSTKTLQFFGSNTPIRAAQNNTAIIEFRVEDVDSVFNRLSDVITPHIIQVPTLMPWGNKSLLFRDPEGNLINFFTPVNKNDK